MKRLIAPAVLVLTNLLVPVQPVEACGDKLLSLARGARLHAAYTARRSASILVYTSRSTGPNTVKDPQFQWSLTQAGHKLQKVQDEAQLDQALNSGRFDVILADLIEASSVSRHIAAMRSKPLVLPVAYKPAQAALTAAEKQFDFVLKAPARSTQHLEAIDRAVKSIDKALKAQARI